MQATSASIHNSKAKNENHIGGSGGSQRPRKRRLSRLQEERPIYVVIVEPHQHVLEHIHTVLRKERLLTREWSMLHFDSHPDLACPNPSIPAKACFLPRQSFASAAATTSNEHTGQTTSSKHLNLYEWLDCSSSGIAEWILPLVLAANLSSIHWVKPSTVAAAIESDATRPPSQLPLGIHTYRVGASVPVRMQDKEQLVQSNGTIKSFLDLSDSSVVKVDWAHPYYLEDHSTAGIGITSILKEVGGGDEETYTDVLALSQPLQLQVLELGPPQSTIIPADSITAKNNLLGAAAAESSNGQQNPLWSLDICLDYFACHNPFLTDLEAKDPIFTRALMDAVYHSRFYSPAIMKTSTRTGSDIRNSEPSDSTTHTTNHDALVVLENYQRDLVGFRQSLVDLLLQLQQQQQVQPGQEIQSNPNSGGGNLSNNEHLGKYYEKRATLQEPSVIGKLVKAFNASPCRHENAKDATSLIAMTKQALPNLTMPHHTTLNATIVNSTISMDSIRPALKRVQQEIADLYHGQDADAATHNETYTTKSPSFAGTLPFIITIARSASDGFTPSHVVEELQDELLENLHSLYCGCSDTKIACRPPVPAPHKTESVELENTPTRPPDCRFQVIFDYGPWEGATFS